MAQETAGTIGIPVLKNEVLPYLADYAKRQERAQLYKQKAEQRAAELAAKRAAEDAKFKSEIKSTEGGFLMPQIQQLNKADIEAAKKRFADQNTSLQEKYELSNNVNRIIDERNNYQKYNEATIKAQLPEMQKYYQVDESDIPVYSSGLKADPSIFNINHVAQFKSAIEDDPNRFKWREVGSNLFKTVGADKYSFTNSAGQQEVIEASNLFIPEVVINPVSKRKVTAQKLNADVAMDVAMGNPKVWKAVTTYEKAVMPQLIQNAAVVNQAAKLGIEVDKYAQSLAREGALNKLFSNMGGVTYSKDIQVPKDKDGSKPPMDYSYKMGETVASVPTFSPDGKIKKAQNFKIGQSSDKGVPLGTTNHQAGLRGIPLTELDDNEVTEIIEYNNDGSVTINRSITYDNPIRRTVYRAKGDIQFFDKAGKPTYRVKKGGIVGNTEAGVILAGPNKNLLGKETGYEITARTKNPFSKITPDIEKEIRIWVSDADAGSIKGNIKKMQKRVPVEGMEEIEKLTF